MAINLWSPNGTVTPSGPFSCDGNDYGICDTIDSHRCTNMMRGLPGGKRARGFGVPCTVPYSPVASTVWWNSTKLVNATDVVALSKEIDALKAHVQELEREYEILKARARRRT